VRFWLDDKPYESVGDPEQYTAEPLLDAISTGGRYRPENAAPYITLHVPNLIRGLGRRRIDADSAFESTEYQYAWDIRADTRWPHGVLAPILEADSTGEEQTLRAHTRWKDAISTLWESSSGSGRIVHRVISNFNFGGGGTLIDSADGKIAQDIIAHKNKLIAIYVDRDTQIIEHSTDGIAWNVAGTTAISTALLSNNVGANEDTVFARLANIGVYCVAIIWDEDSGTITFFSTIDGGDTWVDQAVDIPNGASIQGVAVMKGIGDADRLYVLNDIGLWEVDPTTSGSWTVSQIHGVPGVGGTTIMPRRMVVHQQSLWISTSISDDVPFNMFRVTPTGDGWSIEANKSRDGGVLLGLAGGDGVATHLLGPMKQMESAGEFLYGLVGGTAANRNGALLCHNGKGWHYMKHNATADQLMTWVGVDGHTIHYTKQTTDSVHTAHYLENGDANPTTGVSVGRSSDGYYDLPYYDAGFIEAGGWLRVRINAENLGTTTSEYLNLDYGIDDGAGGIQAQNGTDLGDIIIGTTSISFPSTTGGADNGAGIESVNMGMRVNFNRDTGDTSDSVLLKDLMIDVIKHPGHRDGWVLDVDLDTTAGGKAHNTAEKVYASLETARDRARQVTFYYDNGPIKKGSPKYVKIQPPMRWTQTIQKSGQGKRANRNGYIRVRIEETIG
jgi:hypothetical protein